MRCFKFIYAAIMCCAIALPSSVVAEPVIQSVETAAPAVSPKEPVKILPDEGNPPKEGTALPLGLDFSSTTHAGFLELRRGLIEAVHESETGLSSSEETTNALLDLTELYLAHALVAEGQSIITGLEGRTISEKQTARIAGLSIALNVLDPWSMEVSEADMLLLEGSDKWSGHALLRSLYFIKKDAQEKALPFLAQAAEDVLVLPSPIQEMVLPDLLNVAVDFEDWEVARKFAEIFMKNPNLNEGSAYHYLLGRTAENGQDYLNAFDHYVKATHGLDHWSQLASLSLVKMGIATKTLPPHDVRTMLEQIRFAWRGDALSAEVMYLLVKAELSLHDIPAALEVLGEIIYMNDDAGVVEEAKEQSNLLLSSFYEDGASGKTSLTKFMNGHKRITNDYRFQKGFDRFSETFADYFFAIGASSEAALEYEITHDYLSVAQDLGLFEVTLKRLDQLRLKQVKALMRGGQYDLAEPILAFGPESIDSDMLDQFTFLKAKIFALTGNMQSVLETEVDEPSIGYLRIKAGAYFSMADWKSAAKTYSTLWEREGNEFLFADALNLFLSAYRNNDSSLTLKLAKTFPALTKIPQWSQIADWLVEKRNVVDVLQVEAITTEISEAARVLDVMKVINTASQ